MAADALQEWHDDEINLLDYWQVLRKRGRMIVILFCVSVLATGIHAYFIATKIYEAKVAIMAPKETGGGSGAGFAAALAATGAGQFLGGLLPGGGTSRDAFIAILKSRSMAEELVARFKLKDYYEAKYTEDAIKGLQDATDISVSKEGVITVRVEDKNPKLAAEIANAYAVNLDRMFAKLGTTEGGRQRAFLAERLEKTEKALRQAEETLRHFQEANRTVVLQEQSKGIIDSVARLRGEIIAAEVALESLRAYATENNPQVVQQKARVEELKRQLAQMQYSKGEELPSETKQPGQRRQEITLPVARVPELSMEYVRLMREVKIQETVFTLLTQQFEQAKIAEARDTPIVQLLDKAVPAERKSKPKTVVSMAIAGVLSLFVGVFLAFFLEYVDRMRTLDRARAS